MSRLTLLLILSVWLIGMEEVQPSRAVQPALLGFIGGYLALVAMIAVWSRSLARRLINQNFQNSLRRFNAVVQVARWAVPLWLAIGFVRWVGWGQLVLWVTGSKFHFPGVLLGTLPAFLTWVALWWAEFPADRALREQNIYAELMDGLPVHAPPSLRRHIGNAFRQQLLPIVLPILLILVFRDALTVGLGRKLSPGYTDLLMIPAAMGVYIISPELLKRIFNARTLEDSPLRRRLEEICRRSNLRYRDILLWQTDHSMANAAVIGILPRWRYVLLSDRLIETMTDQQIEAVFAHELGHIVHHHMGWFVVFFAILTLGTLGPGQWLDTWAGTHLPGWLLESRYDTARHLLSAAGVFVAMLSIFGALSRRFEKQADVYAARMMQETFGTAGRNENGPEPDRGRWASHVGEAGAAIFVSALHRVALVNNIPLAARDWFHPSIARRMRFLQEMSGDPRRTREFDRRMLMLYALMTVSLLICGAIVLWNGDL